MAKRGPKKTKNIDWKLLQEIYDSGKTTEFLRKEYHISGYDIQNAVKENLFKTRTAYESYVFYIELRKKQENIPINYKYCKTCNLFKEPEEFKKRESVNSGYRPKCKLCYNKDIREYYNKNSINILPQKNKTSKERKALKYINYYNHLLEKKCIDCGIDDVMVLECDHKHDKIDNISKMVADGTSWDTIVKELEKCEIRCSNCHKKKTHEEMNTHRFRLNKIHGRNKIII